MKNYIINKTREFLRFMVYILLPLIGGGWVGVSCNDFLTIYPTDRIVAEDFWKTKSDVEQMVDGTYQSMLSYDIQERAIIWGAFRSDELIKYSAYSDNTLDNIEGVNLLPTMKYCNWSAFYKVINNCNIVLNHAPGVMAEDPEFTEGDYQVVKAQMLALRSLCYFYLVRTFRDVPYSVKAVEDDSQIELLPQLSPGEVLQHCLDDLAAAEPYIMRTGAYGDWRDKGYFTRDAVHALMADIYLWRAAMTHNKSDYKQVIGLVDKVVAAKDQYYVENYTKSVTGEEDDSLHLYEAAEAFNMIFNNNNMNSHESILEWQYNGQNNSNKALENYYYQSGNEDNYKSTSIVMASSLFATPKKDGTQIYISTNDYRFWNNVYGANSDEAEQLSIRKMVDASGNTVSPILGTGATKSNSRQFKEFRQNWIVYRFTDLLLMKAEALVETAADSTDAVTLQKAFDLVKAVNDRSMTKNAGDKLVFTDYGTMASMEQLVLDERERELCFEGKRWFDLMRYSYRHMTGVNINQRLADTDAWPALYNPMLKLIARKYSGGGGEAVTYKMKNETQLYWLIREGELKVNSLLKQNPGYQIVETISKN